MTTILDLIINDPNVSPELTDALRRNRTEAEARADIAAKGQAAFFSVAKTASAIAMDAAELIFEAQSYIHNLNQRNYISSAAFDDLLIAECRRLVGGDELKARILASAALFGEG